MSGEDRARLLGRLAHDVGKYVARTARNLPPGELPEALVGMLARDLYELEDGRPASAVLEGRLDAHGLRDPRLEQVRAKLREADELEAAVRAGQTAAVRRAASLAVEVAELLRAAALEARGGER